MLIAPWERLQPRSNKRMQEMSGTCLQDRHLSGTDEERTGMS